MSLPSLLRKEVYWTRRNVLGLLLVLLLLPGFFAASSVIFEDVIPRDVPVAVVEQDDDVELAELAMVNAGVSAYADSESYESREAAMAALERETVYAIVEVPHDLNEGGADVTFRFYVDGSMVPFKSPSGAIANYVESRLDGVFDANVAVDHVIVGNDHDLSTYLLPIFLMAVLLLFAFTYVPYNLAQEAPVMDRIRLESSIEALVGAKLVYFTALMLVPIVVFQVASAFLGYDVAVLAPGTVLALLLTFVTFAALSMAVMVLTKFGTLGRFLNVVVLMGLAGFSGLAYPVGYFSPLRRAIVRAMPTHYAMVVTRSSMLRGSSVAAYADWLLGLAVVALLAIVALKLSVVAHRRVL